MKTQALPLEIKTFSEYLQLDETFKNLFTVNEKEKYVDQVWDMLQTAYASLGGIKGNGFKSKEDMMENIQMWKLALRGDHVTACNMYKQKDGRKRVAIGTDGTTQGKSDLAEMIIADMKQNRSYGEVSGSSLNFILRIMGPSDAKKYFIPFEMVEKILHDDEIRKIDEYKYERKIGGSWHEKVMMGNPKLSRYA